MYDHASFDYIQRVYAGVLGKVIGVTTGKPIEGWSYERITSELGEVHGYPHERLGYPLICTDDDISGTFTFLRAIEDCGYRLDLTAQEIADTWLNYLIEGKSVLWWGGNGNSTEHTAYLRLLSGVKAPMSGSCQLNGKRVSEQIGAQIFIDGWAMVCPGDPDQAVDLARKAATVSHDGEAVYGAVALAAMESMAFIEASIEDLVESALSYIPSDCVIAAIIRDIRSWASKNGGDWRATRMQVQDKYGADKHGVGHMIPNHALIHLALWHGDGDLARSLDIVNTCGWDTDCNAGNLGCLLGIRNGLSGIPSDLRDPIADRVYTPTADAGRGISDCLSEAIAIVNMARIPRGLPAFAPHDGATFSFALLGAAQGFQGQGCSVSNPNGQGLKINYSGVPASAMTPTFIPPNLEDMHGYELLASPRFYPGQSVQASLSGEASIEAAVKLHYFGSENELCSWTGPWKALGSQTSILHETIPDLSGMPIFEVGIALRGKDKGDVRLDWMRVDGMPDCDLLKGRLGSMGRSIWVDNCDQLDFWPASESATLDITQNHGRGMAIVGSRGWKDYGLTAQIRPRLGGRFGVAICCQGLRRFVGVLVDSQGHIELGYQLGEWVPLASTDCLLKLDEVMALHMSVHGAMATAEVNGTILKAPVPEQLATGAAALIADESRFDVVEFSVRPSSG